MTFMKKAQNMPWHDLEQLAGQVKVCGLTIVPDPHPIPPAVYRFVTVNTIAFYDAPLSTAAGVHA